MTIPAGQATATFAIAITDDETVELDETITLTLSAPQNAELGTSSATLTIFDN